MADLREHAAAVHAEVQRWRGSFNHAHSGWSAIGDRSHSVYLI